MSILKEISPKCSWKDWCWSWNSNTLVTWCEELAHLKRPWCWERLKAGGEGDDRGWDSWMASPTQNMSLSNLLELVMDRKAWHGVISGVAKSRTWLSNWTELNISIARLANTWRPELHYLDGVSQVLDLLCASELTGLKYRCWNTNLQIGNALWGVYL